MDENRRNRLDLNTPAELAIYNAMGEVEKIGAEERLTNALIKLKEAKELVANFVEGIGLSQLPPEKTESADIEKFAQILGKCCLDNKVNLTSNERHTVYDAFKEYTLIRKTSIL